MEEAIELDRKTMETLKAKLLTVIENGVALADRNTNHVRNLVILGFLAALWLSYYLHQMISPPAYIALPISLVLLLPVLFLAKLLFTLRDVRELPGRIDKCFNGFKSSFDEYHQQLKTRLDEVKRKRKLSDLITFGKDFREVMRLARNTDGLTSAIGGAMVFGNPLFLLVMLAASAATAMLILVAVVTLMMFIV